MTVPKGPSKDPKDPDEVQARIGERIRAYRQRLGVTQEELAWRADLHRTYIADIERGVRNITVRSLVGLAEALQVSVASLLAAPDEQFPAAPGGSRDILLIEDSREDAELTAAAFAHANLTNRLVHVWDGAEALEYLFGTGRYEAPSSRSVPQVILLDLKMPRISGLDVLAKIRADRRTRDIPVIVLTVSRDDRHIAECARLGVRHYIVKPVGFENFSQVTPDLNLRWTLSAAAGPVTPEADATSVP